SSCIESFVTLPEFGSEEMTIIYDVTGWRRKKEDGTIISEHVDVLESAAKYAAGTGGTPFIMAVNDGQLHEIAKALPASCSSQLREFFDDLLSMHASAREKSTALPNLELVNLSFIPSDHLMGIGLDGILSREEWSCLETEQDTPLFGPNSSVVANYHLLSTDAVRDRLLSVAKIADACGYHLPIRSIILLLVNSLLGHPGFSNNLVKPGVEAERNFNIDTRYKAALHRNIFGLNLSKVERKKRVLYEFLADLRVGEETTNDIDELIIFGDKHPDFMEVYDDLIADDPHKQRDPELVRNLAKYLKGEIADEEEVRAFRSLLCEERKRIFIHASPQEFEAYNLWVTCIFHHAGHFIKGFLTPLASNKPIEVDNIIKLVAGLNRVWTGLLIRNDLHQVYVATGLDITTAPISDLLIQKIDAYSGQEAVGVTGRELDNRPEFVLQFDGRKFAFELTMLRFEFLMRVAKGAMPTSFSSEIYSNFQALKQKAIRTLKLQPNTQFMLLLELDDAGAVRETRVNLK
ncbi:hypothetical protein, partial [Haloferula sp.]|uniref:hypothetical protein n=1 Tax=Haloferula sp. TaxID=2497595 RepID=UPI003C7644BE